jgi:hypothetical protein
MSVAQMERILEPRSEGGAARDGCGQPGELRVQAQTGLVGGFGERGGNFGNRLHWGLRLTDAQVAGMGTTAARTELAALFEGLVYIGSA